MSQLATIFEKIKEDFFSNLTTTSTNENREQYQLTFAPFSTGFTSDDFLFLDTNNASEQVHKYLDELYEFSQIANTIPKSNNFWATSDNQNDYIFNKYKTILQSLRLIDPDTLTIEMLYEHPIFEKALAIISDDLKEEYVAFFKLHSDLTKEIAALKETDLDDATKSLQINLKENNLTTIATEWETSGNKQEVESKILEIIKDEIKRFVLKFSENKAGFETALRTHPGSNAHFYLTYCMPNNLHNADELNWKKISISQNEIKRLLQKEDIQNYQAIFGDEQVAIDLENIEFELLFVDVTRAWYDESILESPFWDINILNRDQIEIPSITNKLIFIRRVDLKLNEKSQKNNLLLKANSPKNLGPFIVNPALIKSGKMLQLQSVNKGLKLDRKTILNVSSKLNSSQKALLISKNTKHNFLSKKQQQFIKLAPKLQQKKVQQAQLIQPLKATHGKKQPLIHKKLAPFLKRTQLKGMFAKFKTTRYEFSFIDAATKRKTFVLPKQITVIKNGVKVKNNFEKTKNGNLSIPLNIKSAYKFIIDKPNYQVKNFSFKTNATVSTAKNPMQLSISLVKIKTEPKPQPVVPIDNSFQLIGVVSKQLSPFPNPITKADYV